MLESSSSSSLSTGTSSTSSTSSSSSCPSSDSPKRVVTGLSARLFPCTLRILYPVLFFMSLISPANAQGKCFNLPQGLSITGGEYRRIRSITLRKCALECKDDPSCLAYEFQESGELCYLKSRSLSGQLEKKDETLIGFCLDESEYDESRDRFLDHIATGPELAQKDGIEGDDCRDFCIQTPGAAIYSFIPDDLEDDDSTVGTCTCIEALRGLNLVFNAFSGILPPKRHPRRIKFPAY